MYVVADTSIDALFTSRLVTCVSGLPLDQVAALERQYTALGLENEAVARQIVHRVVRAAPLTTHTRITTIMQRMECLPFHKHDCNVNTCTLTCTFALF